MNRVKKLNLALRLTIPNSQNQGTIIYFQPINRLIKI